MSKKTKIILGLVIATIVVGGAVAYAALQNTGPAVESAKVQSSSLAVTVMGSGKVTALDKTEIYAETQGFIDEAYVVDGERVEEGQNLLKLDVDALRVQLAQAKAGVAQAQAGLDQARFAAKSKDKLVASTKSAIKAAEQALASANSAKAAAQAGWEQATALKEDIDPIVDPVGYAQVLLKVEQATQALSQASTAVAQAQGALAQAKTTLDQTQGSPTSGAIKAAQDGVAAANKSVELTAKAIENAIISAPVGGTVIIAPSAAAMAGAAVPGASSGPATLSKGQAITPGAPILSIVDTSTLGFTAEIDETNISRVAVGQKVLLKLDAFPGQEVSGTVRKISTSAQPTLTGGNIFQVEITITGAEDMELRLGMKGDATIEVEKVPNALSLPIEAIFSEGGSEYVYVIDADSKLVKTDIVAGTTSTQTSTEILEGVKEGDRVALAGSVAYSDGMRVTINDAKK